MPYLVSNPLTLGTNLIWHFYLGITHSDSCNNKLQHSHTVVMHGDRPSNQTAWRGKHTCPNSSCRRVAVWCKASNVLINEERSEKETSTCQVQTNKKKLHEGCSRFKVTLKQMSCFFSWSSSEPLPSNISKRVSVLMAQGVIVVKSCCQNIKRPSIELLQSFDCSWWAEFRLLHHTNKTQSSYSILSSLYQIKYENTTVSNRVEICDYFFPQM